MNRNGHKTKEINLGKYRNRKNNGKNHFNPEFTQTFL